MIHKPITIFLFLLLFLPSCHQLQKTESSPKVINGTIHLENWNFDKHPIINLKGQWLFAWKKWHPPGQLLSETKLASSQIQVPTKWNKYTAHGSPAGSKGFATYEIDVLLPGRTQPYAVHIPEISSSYSLYINGKKQITVGSPSKDIKTAIPRVESKVIVFSPKSSKATLTFHVANFHQFKGGIRDPVYLGPESAIRANRLNKVSMLYFFLGGIFSIGVYHLRLFAIRRDEYSYLYFGLFCLLISTRLLVFEERLIMTILPNMSLNILFKLEYLTFYLGAGSVLAYLFHLFPKTMNTRFYYAIQSIILCFSAVVFFLPVFLFTQSLKPFQYLSFGCIVYIIIVLWRAFRENRFGIKTFMVGVGSFLITAVNDLLSALGVISTPYLFHVGAFIFLLCQSSILIRKYAKAFKVIAHQKAGLDKQNKSLNFELLRRKQAEKALRTAAKQEKYALVGQVAGKIAHDFNNILGAIMGNSELALMDCKEDETRQTLSLINDLTQRGKNLTKNLVAFAMDQEPKQEFFKIDEKIDLVLKLLKKDLKGIKLIRDDSQKLPDILADPGMIEHALINLIQNSIHATSLLDDRIIAIRTYINDKNICIEVEDNGCGIPDEFIHKIYDPSFTLKGSKDENGSYRSGIKGTGYGMSNVIKYVEQHNGSIAVDSQFGAGTKFIISMPVMTKELTPEEKSQIISEKTYTNKHILLVEDEKAICDVQYRILTHAPCNHVVDATDNGKDALVLFNKNRYDFVSLDYILPGQINGMDIYNQIRKTNTDIPILFISGNLEFLESIQNLQSNDTLLDHLPKPFCNKSYISHINRLLDRSAQLNPPVK